MLYLLKSSKSLYGWDSKDSSQRNITMPPSTLQTVRLGAEVSELAPSWPRLMSDRDEALQPQVAGGVCCEASHQLPGPGLPALEAPE